MQDQKCGSGNLSTKVGRMARLRNHQEITTSLRSRLLGRGICVTMNCAEMYGINCDRNVPSTRLKLQVQLLLIAPKV